MAISISLKDMIKNGVHFGHKASRWNPKMKKYIFGKRSGLHIINLEKTADKLVAAMDFVHDTIADGKTVLIVATKSQTATIVAEYAEAAKIPFVTNRWLGGTLTNFKTIKGRVKYLKKLEAQVESGELEKYTKKEQSGFQKELGILDKRLGGLRDMDNLPNVIFVTDINADAIAIKEAKKLGIPIVGFADTNTDPTSIDYAIPANDDAINSLKYLLGVLNEVILDARSNPKVKKEKEGEKKEMKISDEVIAEKEAGATHKK